MAAMDNEDIYTHIGSLIKSRRKRLGLTQDKLARRLGISRASLANVETGRQKVLVHQLYGFAGALELTVIDFLPAPANLHSTRDLKQFPLPDGLNSNQKQQITRLLEGTQTETAQREDNNNDNQAKQRPKKAGSSAS